MLSGFLEILAIETDDHSIRIDLIFRLTCVYESLVLNLSLFHSLVISYFFLN